MKVGDGKCYPTRMNAAISFSRGRAPAYAPSGEPALAEYSHHGFVETRLIGALNAHTGAVQAFSCSQLSRERFVEFYQQVTQAYPGVQTIWMVQDNWSLHFHPDVLVALEAQQSPFPFSVPSNWPKVPSPAAKKRYETWHLPLQLVQLPTYSRLSQSY